MKDIFRGVKHCRLPIVYVSKTFVGKAPLDVIPVFCGGDRYLGDTGRSLQTVERGSTTGEGWPAGEDVSGGYASASVYGR